MAYEIIIKASRPYLQPPSKSRPKLPFYSIKFNATVVKRPGQQGIVFIRSKVSAYISTTVLPWCRENAAQNQSFQVDAEWVHFYDEGDATLCYLRFG